MTKHLIVLFTALLVLSFGATLTATELPCVVSQLQVATRPEPSQVSGGPLYAISVTAMVTYSSDPNCGHTTYDVATGIITFHPIYIVERRDSGTGLYTPYRAFPPVISNDGSGRSRRVLVLETSLEQGSYRVRSTAGSNLIESLPFAVGSTASDFAQPLPFSQPVPRDDRFGLAYGQASAIVFGGNLYFRGNNPDLKRASGYLYQDRADGTTTVVQTTFDMQLDASDAGFTALPQSFDLGWMRANTAPAVGLDAGLPIVGCITTSGGTTCFEVFNPSVPFRNFSLNYAPFGGGSLR